MREEGEILSVKEEGRAGGSEIGSYCIICGVAMSVTMSWGGRVHVILQVG